MSLSDTEPTGSFGLNWTAKEESIKSSLGSIPPLGPKPLLFSLGSNAISHTLTIIDCNYDNYLTKYKDNYDYYEEDSEFRDSSLSVVYKIRNFCKDDYKYLIMLKLILLALPTRVLDSIDKNMRPYQHHKLINLVDDEGLLSQNIYNNRDLIDKVNTKNLYKHYKNIIKNTPFIFVFGNYDKEEMNKHYPQAHAEANEYFCGDVLKFTWNGRTVKCLNPTILIENSNK